MTADVVERALEHTTATGSLLVHEAHFLAEGVVGLVLVDAENQGRPLPAWEPGAHINVELPSGLVRSYSLCGNPVARDRYEIAVHRSLTSEGGSREIHETGLVGQRLKFRGPVNNFRLVEAPAYLFLAGGIGVTPLVPMLEAVQGSGAPTRFIYGAKTLDAMALIPRLRTTAHDSLSLVCQDTDGLPDLRAEIAAAPAGAAIYCCGPSSMLQAVETACVELGIRDQLHLEYFAPPENPVTARGSATRAIRQATDFEVVLARSGKTVTVPKRRSILNAIKRELPDVVYGCGRGFCGDCETKVLDGMPEHRDFVLTPEQREAGDAIMICVSRCLGDRLVLDL